MKRIKTALALSALASLAACGLRGDLERPPPIFSEPPTEEAQQPVDTAAEFADVGIRDSATYYNSLGGEIPKPAPDVDVEEESMGEVGPG
ncbi:MAG: lipoprotein [Pseudomonadota bacterium]